MTIHGPWPMVMRMSEDHRNDCLAVLLTFDTDSERQIRAAAHKAAAALGRDPAKQGGRPHITLLPTRSEAPRLIEGVCAVARNASSMSVSLSHLGYFASPGVCFLGATPSPELVRLHASICALAQPGDQTIFDGLYLPGTWVPHCTLAMGVFPGQLEPVIEAIKGTIPLPFVVRAAALDIVEITARNILPIETVWLP